MSRRGYSLMEMLVVITVSTVLMGIAVGTVHLLFQAQRGGRDHASQAAILARLAEQFRDDVRAAVHIAAGETKDQWRFSTADDRAVTYRATPGEVERSERVAEKTVRRESYMLKTDRSAKITIDADSTSAMASLIVAAPGGEIRMNAALGADLRFQKGTVPFSSDENRDSPPPIAKPMPEKEQQP